MIGAVSNVGAAIAKHPGLTTFAVASTALIGLSMASENGRVGGLEVTNLSDAAGGVGLLMGLFTSGKASSVGWGLVGASLLTRGITAVNG